MQAPWQYPADLHLICWLETMGYKYDCITDEDVTYDGLARLEQYNVIITGSHPGAQHAARSSMRCTITRSAAAG